MRLIFSIIIVLVLTGCAGTMLGMYAPNEKQRLEWAEANTYRLDDEQREYVEKGQLVEGMRKYIVDGILGYSNYTESRSSYGYWQIYSVCLICDDVYVQFDNNDRLVSWSTLPTDIFY